MQSISAEVRVYLNYATTKIPNDAEELMTPLAMDMADPISLDTTTIGNTDTLPIHYNADHGLLESNPCTSDTKGEPSTSLSRLEEECQFYFGN